MRKSTLFTKNRVALAVSVVLGAGLLLPAQAQQAETENNAKDVEVIQVKGIRGSLARSMDMKRDGTGVMDAISAEEMGKFPDTNLAESLQRITGVSVSRANGEGSQITVRGFGPEFNLVTLNGRQMAGTGFSRSFNFENLSSEGVSGFGTGINATLVDGDVEYDNFVLANQAILPGLSNSANWQVFYEKHGWSVKLTAAWRDEYLAGQGQPDTTDAPPNYVEEYLQWDLSVNYAVNDNLTVFFEGINLTNETERSFGRFERQFLSAAQYGPRYAIGVRYTMGN